MDRRATMDEKTEPAALLHAMTTEHFGLQTANSSTYLEASARSQLPWPPWTFHS